MMMTSPVDSAAAQAACKESRVGKLTRSALYFHKSAFKLVPPVIRHLVLAAEIRMEDRRMFYRTANVLKVAKDGASVSFLWYPDFDSDPHPALTASIHVPLAFSPWADSVHGPRVKDPSERTYAGSANPPILHRKEEFVASDHPLRGKFAALTRAEERAGLLSKTPGFKRQWRERLKKAGYRIWGHRLRRVS
jgi:DNA phosphorothioation-associated putative methyltransferase